MTLHLVPSALAYKSMNMNIKASCTVKIEISYIVVQRYI